MDCKIEIDLLDFCKSGKFDWLKIGMSKEEVSANFPEPDEVGILNKKQKIEIWRYGNLELHFIENKLAAIFTDYIEDVKGGDKLIVNRWIFSPGNDFSLIGILKTLNNQKIDYEKRTNNIGQIGLKLLGSGVELLFDNEDRTQMDKGNAYSASQFHLVAIEKR